MEFTEFTITRIDMATQGWNVQQTAEFYGVTPEELMAGMEKGKYCKGEVINGERLWHPDILRMFKWMRETGFVPLGFMGGFDGTASLPDALSLPLLPTCASQPCAVHVIGQTENLEDPRRSRASRVIKRQLR